MSIPSPHRQPREDRNRRVVELRQHLKPKEIAERMGLDVSTVYGILRYQAKTKK